MGQPNGRSGVSRFPVTTSPVPAMAKSYLLMGTPGALRCDRWLITAFQRESV